MDHLLSREKRRRGICLALSVQLREIVENWIIEEKIFYE